MKPLKVFKNVLVYIVANLFYYSAAAAGCIGLAFVVDKISGGRLYDFDPER